MSSKKPSPRRRAQARKERRTSVFGIGGPVPPCSPQEEERAWEALAELNREEAAAEAARALNRARSREGMSPPRIQRARRSRPASRRSRSSTGDGNDGDDDGEAGSPLYLPIEVIKPHPVSERIYRDGPDDQLLDSIRTTGRILQPLLVAKRADFYRLISGHRRLKAGKKLGLEKVPVRLIQVDEGDEAAAIIEANRSREKNFSQRLREAEVLEPVLAAQAHERMVDGGKRARTREADSPRERRTRDALAHRVGLGSGVQLERLREIARKRPDLLAEIDAGKKSIGGAWAELRREVQRTRQAKLARTVKPRADVMHADCRTVLPTLEDGRFAAIVTDPPYGLSEEGRTVERAGTVPLSSDFGRWDHLSEQEAQELIDFSAREFFRLLRAGGAAYLFTGDGLLPSWVVALKRAGFILPRPYLLAWVKTNPPPSVRKRGWRSGLEPIVYALKPGPDCFNWLSDSEMTNGIACPIVTPTKRLHPTQKPVELVKRLIEVSTLPGDEVLDPFAGSGTTGDAALRGGRHALLIERDSTFHAVATARIHQVVCEVKPQGAPEGGHP